MMKGVQEVIHKKIIKYYIYEHVKEFMSKNVDSYKIYYEELV
jgi:hypothetical protein